LRTGQPVRDVILGLPLSASGVRRAIRNPDDPLSRTLGLKDPGSPPVAVRWLLLNSMPLIEGQDADSPVRGVTTFSDITAPRRSLETLKHSEEKYRGLVETLPVMLLQSDRHMRVLYANPQTKVVSGYDQPELQEPGSWQRLVHSDDLPGLFAATEGVL